MRRPFRLPRAAAFAALLATASVAMPLRAQLSNGVVLTAPTHTAITFGSGPTARTVSQLAMPLVVVLPFGEKFSVDVSSAYASSRVTVNDSTTSEITGITDTQVRANLRVGSDNVLFTFGVNLPTGQYSVPEGQQEAAGQVGNDFLFFPISSMGNGLAMTGGLAFAVPVGNWNFGAGVSGRKSSEFAAFTVASEDFRFTPADEYRVTMSADRPVGSGQVSFGVTYSAFGEDVADTTTYSTGDRIIATAGWSTPIRSSDLFVSVWNLYRLEGEVLGASAPAENVINGSVSLSFAAGPLLLQPNVESRLWQIGSAKAGDLTTAGLRLRVPLGPLGLFPSVGYSFGTLFSVVDGAATKVNGLRASLTVRVN